MSLTEGGGPDVAAAMHAHCTALGLHAWVFDGDGVAVKGPCADGAQGLPDLMLVAEVARRTREAEIRNEDFAPPTPIHGCVQSLVGVSTGRGNAGTVLVAQTGGESTPRPDRLAALLVLIRDDFAHAAQHRSLVHEFSNKLVQAYEETYTLFRIMRLMASSTSPFQQIQVVCRNVQQILPFAWVATAFRDEPRVVGDLRGRLVLAGDQPLSPEAFATEVHQLAQNAREDGWTRVSGPATSRLAGLIGAEIVCDPITYDGAVIGVLVAGNKVGPDTDIASPEIQYIDAVSDYLGTFHENIARFAEQRAMSLGTLQSLTAAIDAKDRYTRGHSERVAYLSHALAIAMGFNSERAERARIAGLIHDIGKIGVPEAILCKAGRLSDEEFTAIKQHPDIGYGILKGIVLLEDALPGVLHHHERWDGRGYPQGLAGEGIPLIARIIGLADTFDAMSSSRSYRPTMTRLQVLTEISRCAGTQFDPTVVEAFARVDLAAFDEFARQRPADEHPALRAAA